MVFGLDVWSILSIVIGVIFLLGIRIVRPTDRALVERFGKYNRYRNAGFAWIIPIIERLYMVNITEADGFRRAAIKKADGEKQATILRADGEAQAIKLINEAANKYFIGNAQKLKQLEVTQASLQDNSKIIVTREGINPVLVLGGDSIPFPLKTKK